MKILDCPSKWIKINGRCIYNSFDYSNNVKTWKMAKQACDNMGAYLVSIRTKADQIQLGSNFKITSTKYNIISFMMY